MEGGYLDDETNNSSGQPVDDGRTLAWSEVSTKEKIVTALIIFLAFVGVFAGYYVLSTNLTRPFVERLANNDLTNDNQNGLAETDSDRDGLTDYEEVFVYKTSPYLEDSDSDGFKDKEEIDKGFDPNCAGESCNTGLSSGTGSTSSVPKFIDVNNLTNISPDEIDVKQLRQSIISMGGNEEYINGLSDDEIISLYYQALQNSNSEDANPSTSTTSNSTTNIKQLNDISAAEIRQALIAKGVDETILNQISDEDLQELFLEQLSGLSQ